LFHVLSFKEQVDTVLRSWLGTRWLLRWDKEVDLVLKLLYYGVTIGRAVQTLGEEYTDVWQHSAFSGKVPSRASRTALVLLPTLPSYILAKWGSHLSALSPKIASTLRVLPMCLEVAAEVNLAIFYLRGTYYDLTKRMLGIQHVTTPVSLSRHSK
jgi:peroxin-10